jgi:[protein-PII] uridylyltransferase
MASSLDQIFSPTAEKAEILSNLRLYLEERREQIRDYHRRGASGGQIVGFLTALMDDVLQQAYRRALLKLPSGSTEEVEKGCVLLALGGYGRKELNPHSDIDLMFLYREETEGAVQKLSKEVLHLLWDLNFTVGHSFRTVREAVEIGRSDYTVRTSMMESRLIMGSETLRAEFDAAFNKLVERDVKGYIDQKCEEMRREHEEYGSTVYLLEPNVKRSEGGLRDIHYLRWIGMARHRCQTLAQLHQMGLLSNQDYSALGQAQDFLWRVRNEMHFHSGRPTDILSFDEQERLSAFFGFEPTEHLLAVERFMQQYYIYTARIHDISSRFIEGVLSPSFSRRLFNRLVAREVEGAYLLTSERISLSPKAGAGYLSDGVNLVNLFLLSKSHGVRISKETLERVSRALADGASFARFPEACERFRLLLSAPGRIADTLREMHRTQLLWRFIPEYERIYRLVQFNRYHKYTVDEHSIRAVEEAEALAGRSDLLSQVYREIKKKTVLHLALLLHDAGKGLAGDHSKEGVRIAREVASRLRLNREETDLLLFLIDKHLTMSHIAFRRDLSDPKVLLLFAQEVRTSEVLRMLLILTYADIQAVGQGTWTNWKGELLLELYEKTLEELTGAPSGIGEEERVGKVLDEVKDRLTRDSPDLPERWLEEAFSAMNRRYILVTPVDRIVRDLRCIRRLAPRSVHVEAENDLSTGTTSFTIYTFDDIIPGLFSKIAGVLAARGLQILDAQVDTRKNGVVVDTFRVSDPHYTEAPPPHRLEEVKRKIAEVLLGRVEVESLFPQKTLFIPALRPIAPKPTTVEVDNETSDHYTIIDIFSQDKQGLLYVITRTIFELGLSVYSSKIATRLDQIVDVFYVKDREGRKLTDPEAIREVKERLASEIQRFHEEG